MNNIFWIVLWTSLFLAGCVSGPAPEKEAVGMPNPAAVHCEKTGGKVEIWVDEEGNQTGICRRSDGSLCEEWALFRDGECRPPDEGLRPLRREP